MTPSLIFVRHQSIFRATQNFLNQFNIYLYATGTIFSKHVFLFCATLDIFSRLLLKPGPGPWTRTLDPDPGPGSWTWTLENMRNRWIWKTDQKATYCNLKINTENLLNLQANHLKKQLSKLFRETENLRKNKNEFRSD